ncbi:hypothetical protein ACIOWG_03385 [Streptomyces sp. NPDC087658]|uniref:Rv1733c family protein n=1 Tax=Streptomyces sp. NPDC087658 TaxID=3365800 RepID=UPI0037F42AA5
MVGLWRWRRNPLRRRTDLTEAWVALAALLLLALAVPAAGRLCGGALDTALRESIRSQHEQRRPTTAEVVSLAKERDSLVYDTESATGPETGRRTIATWHLADGTGRTGTVSAPLTDPRPGDTFLLWTDRQGNPVRPPMDLVTARFHAVVAGVLAATLAAALVECGRRLIVWRLVQRRYERLDRAWARAGPDWGRTGAGS